jgi:hypothetical protein
VTTNAAVIPAGSKAASTAACSLAASKAAGDPAFGSTSPIGHGWVDGSGSALLTTTGLNATSVLPIGRATQPWLPTCFATRTTPFGIVTWTVRAARSTFGAPSFARSSYGATK